MNMTNNSLKKMGYLIRFHRRKLNLSQIQFADAIGISFRNLQRLEAGEVEPRLETLNLIATYMKIPVSSLIRPTDEINMFIKEVSTCHEQNYFVHFHNEALILGDDLMLAQKLIQQDSIHSFDKSFYAFLDGTKVQLSEELSLITGVTEQNSEIDNYVAFGTSLERWEYVFRAKMNKAIIQNYYFFPKGFKVLEEYHFNLKPNPDSPTSECYIRDITARYELESWLKLVHANRLSY